MRHQVDLIARVADVIADFNIRRKWCAPVTGPCCRQDLLSGNSSASGSGADPTGLFLDCLGIPAPGHIGVTVGNPSGLGADCNTYGIDWLATPTTSFLACPSVPHPIVGSTKKIRCWPKGSYSLKFIGLNQVCWPPFSGPPGTGQAFSGLVYILDGSEPVRASYRVIDYKPTSFHCATPTSGPLISTPASTTYNSYFNIAGPGPIIQELPSGEISCRFSLGVTGCTNPLYWQPVAQKIGSVPNIPCDIDAVGAYPNDWVSSTQVGRVTGLPPSDCNGSGGPLWAQSRPEHRTIPLGFGNDCAAGTTIWHNPNNFIDRSDTYSVTLEWYRQMVVILNPIACAAMVFPYTFLCMVENAVKSSAYPGLLTVGGEFSSALRYTQTLERRTMIAAAGHNIYASSPFYGYACGDFAADMMGWAGSISPNFIVPLSLVGGQVYGKRFSGSFPTDSNCQIEITG